MLFTCVVIFAIIGFLFIVIGLLSRNNSLTASGGIPFLIASAAMYILRYYMSNPGSVDGFFRAVFSR